MGQFTISMAIVNSFFDITRGYIILHPYDIHVFYYMFLSRMSVFFGLVEGVCCFFFSTNGGR